jgi:Flp pilus assembly protein TadB
MSLRALLVALIVTATAAFVVGVALERNSGESGHEHRAEATRSTSDSSSGEARRSEAGEASHAEAGESAEHRRAEEAGEPASSEKDEELRPLGIDIEAWPFVTLAALTSLALAGAAWLRPQAIAVLLAVAAAMLAFAALDVREVFHQVDESNDGLAVLAAAVAALHAAAGAIATTIAARAHRAPPDAAGTMPA